MTYFIELHTFYAGHRILLNSRAIISVTPERKDRNGTSLECAIVKLKDDYENVRETYDEIKEKLEPRTSLSGSLYPEVR